MSEAVTIYLSLTVSLAILVLAYVLGVTKAFKARVDQPAWALVPVLTPIWAWRAGARFVAVLLGLAALTYGLVQLWAHTRG